MSFCIPSVGLHHRTFSSSSKTETPFQSVMAQATYSPLSNKKKIHITGGIRQYMKALGQLRGVSSSTRSGHWNHPYLRGLRMWNIMTKRKKAGPMKRAIVTTAFWSFLHGHVNLIASAHKNATINQMVNMTKPKVTQRFRNVPLCLSWNDIFWGKFDEAFGGFFHF